MKVLELKNIKCNQPKKIKMVEEIIKDGSKDEYVIAGFTKMHIDTSMKLKEDKNSNEFNTRIISDRGAKFS